MKTRIALRAGDKLWKTRVDANRVSVGDGTSEVSFTQDESGRLVAMRDGVELSGVAVMDGQRIWVVADGQLFDFTIDDGRSATRRSGGHDPQALTPPMPATVLRVNVQPGAAVANGDVIVVLEAMKMELSIRAPRDGVIRAVQCKVGELVQPGVVLVEMEDEGKA
jgi:3-methylcrotonyl-CoA carboxylase alpha subunit